jgi:hypothetical protein
MIEERREAIGRRGRRRRKQLLDDLKRRRGYEKLKEKSVDFSLWRASFRRVYGLGVRQTTELIN